MGTIEFPGVGFTSKIVKYNDFSSLTLKKESDELIKKLTKDSIVDEDLITKEIIRFFDKYKTSPLFNEIKRKLFLKLQKAIHDEREKLNTSTDGDANLISKLYVIAIIVKYITIKDGSVILVKRDKYDTPEPAPVPCPPQAKPQPPQAKPQPPQAKPRPPQAKPRPPQAKPRPPQAKPRPPQAKPRPPRYAMLPGRNDPDVIQEFNAYTTALGRFNLPKMRQSISKTFTINIDPKQYEAQIRNGINHIVQPGSNTRVTPVAYKVVSVIIKKNEDRFGEYIEYDIKSQDKIDFHISTPVFSPSGTPMPPSYGKRTIDAEKNGNAVITTKKIRKWTNGQIRLIDPNGQPIQTSGFSDASLKNSNEINNLSISADLLKTANETGDLTVSPDSGEV